MMRFLRRRQDPSEIPQQLVKDTLEELRQQTREVLRKSPEEVAGDPLEPFYYGMKAARLFENGQHEETRRLLRENLRRFPNDHVTRVVACKIFTRLGDYAEAIEAVSALLVVKPFLSMAHRMMATALLRRGDREAAERVLEAGWKQTRKLHRLKPNDPQRAEYFSILNEDPPPEDTP